MAAYSDHGHRRRDVRARLNLDPETTRWLARLLYRDGIDVTEAVVDEMSSGAPLFAEPSEDVLRLQEIMAELHIGCREAGVTHHLSLNVYEPSLIHHSDSSNPEDPSTQAVSGILGRAAS